MSQLSEAQYSYKNVPLSPAIIEELIEELFAGRLILRQHIVNEVVKYHEKKGGAKSNAQDIPRSVKKALSNLKSRGEADNPSYGYWRIGNFNSPEAENMGNITSSDIIILKPQIIADKVFGTGTSSVYLYYLPMYRQKAETENETAWPCKVGRSDRDPLLRILSQASTALPEKPRIALIIKTSFPSQLEIAIHSILTIPGKKMDSSPGSEWFLTSPNEVEEIHEFILNNPLQKEG